MKERLAGSIIAKKDKAWRDEEAKKVVQALEMVRGLQGFIMKDSEILRDVAGAEYVSLQNMRISFDRLLDMLG